MHKVKPPAKSIKMGLFALAGSVILASCSTVGDGAADKLSRSAEMAHVNRNLAADQVAGNLTKYVGQYVRFDCRVINVLAADSGNPPVANASCQSPISSETTWVTGGVVASNGFSALFILTGDDVPNLDANHSIVVLGSVASPADGTTTGGEQKQFPVIRADYIDKE